MLKRKIHPIFKTNTLGQKCLLMLAMLGLATMGQAKQPNIVLIMTDDQGYGDFGIMGNPIINTPHLDQLARESATMDNFYVSPVCSPTRANLMTGRYNYRTRVVDTYKGRSMMEPDEYTIAEALADNGYATGIFGKWHLGDNYPLRATDQGFQEALVHFGGGLGQPSEPIENKRRYTNPILFHNNEKVETRGYCTDLYFEAASEFIDRSIDAHKPFFAYIATNAPHSPYHDVPEALYQKYKTKDLKSIMLDDNVSEDDIARIFAMIENIDVNVGRVIDQLERRDVTRDTIVIYLNDNGPNSRRFVGEFRGRKNEIHEGGIRSPLWVRWPARLQAGTRNDRVSAHYDIMPTLIEATGSQLPQGHNFDGLSLLPLLEGKKVEWPDRNIYIQAHRGNEPIAEHSMMVRSQKWKLLRPTGFHEDTPSADIGFELYDIEKDPGETRNLVNKKPEVVKNLLRDYTGWFNDVGQTRPDNYAPPRMRIGKGDNQRLVLNKQDRRIVKDGFEFEWAIQIDQSGLYDLTLQWAKPVKNPKLKLKLGDADVSVATKNAASLSFEKKNLKLKKGPMDLQIITQSENELPYFVILSKSE